MLGDQSVDRFEVQINEGEYRGGLFELERVTTFHVVDLKNGQVRLELHGVMSASLDTNTGGWGEPVFFGVVEVILTDDGHHVLVKYHDGVTETILIP